ncbi:MAG: CvpA family protein [Deltaproteobacteria bacterium]|nr:CvpA family protein [Deltaproteobacteria bacterium]
MNPFDIFICILLAFCLIRGLFRGLVSELSSIICVLGGFYAAYTYYQAVSIPLSKWITNTDYLNIFSFFIIFTAIFICISLMGKLIKIILKIVLLGWFDRISGAGFGAVKGILIAAVLLFTFTTFLPQGSSFVKNSVISPYISTIAEKMTRFVAKKLNRSFTINNKGLREFWKNLN